MHGEVTFSSAIVRGDIVADVFNVCFFFSSSSLSVWRIFEGFVAEHHTPSTKQRRTLNSPDCCSVGCSGGGGGGGKALATLSQTPNKRFCAADN